MASGVQWTLTVIPCRESINLASRSRHVAAIRSSISGAFWPRTTTVFGLIIPAFSYAISEIDFPSWASWSRAIVVIATPIGCVTFVASNRPPRPTSRTASSTSACLNATKAAAVVTSKNVGDISRRPSRSSRLTARRTVSTAHSNSLVVIGLPAIEIRSSSRTR